MEFFRELLQQCGYAFLQLIIYPYYYVAVLFIALQYRQQMLLERKLFQTRLYSVLNRTGYSILWGWVGGIAVSIVMAFTGATLQPEIILYIWIISIIFILFRVRFLCLAYSVGVIGIMHGIAVLFPQMADIPALEPMIKPLLKTEMSSLLMLVALLHLIEALLVKFQGSRAAAPVFYESKRGKIVGAYRLQQFWAVPLFLFVPSAVSHNNAMIPWTPLLDNGLWSGGWTIAALPVVIGFSAFSISRLPQEQSRLSSNMLFIYSGAMFVLAVSVYYLPVLTIAVSAAGILLHEAIIWWNRREEKTRSPFFVQGEHGLKILAVLPNSAAEELGLLAGEIIHKVNGRKVSNKEQLHKAMRLNSAFCKLEVINLEGQSKFVQRPLFSGEHHQLGIVLAPDQDAAYYVEVLEPNLISYMKTKASGLSRIEQKTRNI